ncbi:hypothetical protein ACFY2M_35370 [Streptomyces sp. NPDC001276]|uniref:hypothetical protein n=1 Tax=Streptomyces sp. NPDC001276 TaxID=3364555 RepID=UPI0036CB5B55
MPTIGGLHFSLPLPLLGEVWGKEARFSQFLAGARLADRRPVGDAAAVLAALGVTRPRSAVVTAHASSFGSS